jgi:hypothetical protein
MTRFITLCVGAVALVSAAVLMGCSAEKQSEPAATPTAPTAQSAATEPTEGSDEEAEIKEALAKLSPEDRALAEKQKTCPVTDEPLGSMGTPIKVTVDGREAFVCCEGCVEELKNNFAKYEEKLPEV